MEKKNLNAKQMYQYAVDNNFGTGFNEKWGVKHFSIVEQNLSSDEFVQMSFIGLHNYISGTKHDSNYAYAITNKRIIMAQKKLVGENMQTVNFSNINDIKLDTGLVFGVLTIDTFKETFNVALAKGSAKEIHNKIHEVFESVNEDADQLTTEKSELSVADELEKYKKLLDSGAINDQEFSQLKKKLLGL